MGFGTGALWVFCGCGCFVVVGVCLYCVWCVGICACMGARVGPVSGVFGGWSMCECLVSIGSVRVGMALEGGRWHGRGVVVPCGWAYARPWQADVVCVWPVSVAFVYIGVALRQCGGLWERVCWASGVGS